MHALQALTADEFADRLHQETYGEPLSNGPANRRDQLLDFAEWMIEHLHRYGLDLVPRLPSKH